MWENENMLVQGSICFCCLFKPHTSMFNFCCLFYQGKSCFQLCTVLSPGEEKNFLCIFHKYICVCVTWVCEGDTPVCLNTSSIWCWWLAASLNSSAGERLTKMIKPAVISLLENYVLGNLNSFQTVKPVKICKSKVIVEVYIAKVSSFGSGTIVVYVSMYFKFS